MGKLLPLAKQTNTNSATQIDLLIVGQVNDTDRKYHKWSGQNPELLPLQP